MQPKCLMMAFYCMLYITGSFKFQEILVVVACEWALLGKHKPWHNNIDVNKVDENQGVFCCKLKDLNFSESQLRHLYLSCYLNDQKSVVSFGACFM
jgi:hypothetical protein